MKVKKIFLTLTLLLLITAQSFTVFSQTKTSSTVTTDQTIAFLLKDNAEKKEEIAARDRRIADLETQVALEQENSASIGKSYDAAKLEIINLKAANESLRKAVSTNEQTIALLQSDDAKQREKVKKATKAKWKAYGAAAIAIAISYLLH